MAGGKLTPRQKMINLMYLVFVAMLALNMSKEVLTAFGLMNEKFESANTVSMATNKAYAEDLAQKAQDNASQYADAKAKFDKVLAASNKFYNFLESLKNDIQEGYDRDEKTGKLPYEAMDKGDKVDEQWFQGDGYSEKGNQIIAEFEAYKSSMKAALGDEAKTKLVIEDVERRFNTDDVVDREGVKKKYLDYHFKGYPGISSITKLSALQFDIKSIEANTYSSLVGATALQAASMSNYKAIVIAEKSAFFSGETFKGKVVLGRYDDSTVPTAVTVNGKTLDLKEAMEGGQVNLTFPTGGVGEHDIKGTFTFMEDGAPIEIPIDGNYIVVPKPNSATISADKMNVVYRGVENPMTISFAGIADSDVNATAPGLSKGSKPGQYVMRPQQGTEVVINVTGKLPNGETVPDRKTFRIKSIPPPTGHVRGESGVVKGPASSLENSTVSAKILDFDFEVDVQVTGFNLKVTGQPTVVVQGNRMSPAAITAIKRAGRGDQVTISEIKTKLVGAPIDLLKCSPVIFEIQ